MMSSNTCVSSFQKLNRVLVWVYRVCSFVFSRRLMTAYDVPFTRCFSALLLITFSVLLCCCCCCLALPPPRPPFDSRCGRDSGLLSSVCSTAALADFGSTGVTFGSDLALVLAALVVFPFAAKTRIGKVECIGVNFF